MRLFVIFVAVVGLALTVEAGIFKAAEYNSFFSKFLTKYSKSYTAATFMARLATFRANFDKVTQNNANKNRAFTLAVNEFADLTAAEFKATFLTLRPPKSASALLEGAADASIGADAEGDDDKKPKKKSKKELEAEEAAKKKADSDAAAAAKKKLDAERQKVIDERNKLFEERQKETARLVAERESTSKISAKEAADATAWAALDWRTKGVVGKVKHQRTCGGCWAFATIATVESALAIKNGGDVPVLSEQALISCNTGNQGCRGGWFTSAFNWLAANGLSDSTAYPYENKESACKTDAAKSLHTIKGFEYGWGSDAKLLSQLKKGPTGIAVDATNLQLMGSEGIYREINCTTTLVNHAMAAVGTGTDKSGMKYVIIRNSWGSTWGDQGYYRHEINGNNVCGIHIGAYNPIV